VGAGYRGQGTGYKVQGTGYKVQGAGGRVQGGGVTRGLFFGCCTLGEMSYKDLEIWQMARSLVKDIHQMTLNDLPTFEMYEGGSQIRRSMVLSKESKMPAAWFEKTYLITDSTPSSRFDSSNSLLAPWTLCPGGGREHFC
jgi:hypothetical protein